MLPSFVLAFLLVAPPVADVQASASTQAAGLQALDRKDYQQAKQIFLSLTAADAKDYSAFFNLALAETALKENEPARQHFQKVLELHPGLYEAQLNLGILDIRDQKAADAVPLLKAAVAGRPNQARAQRYLGDALLATGDFAAASEAYRAALAIDPRLAAAELGWGQSLLHAGKPEESLPHYRASVSLDPALKSYLLEPAVAFTKANQPEPAIALLKEFPDDPAAREELGRLFLSLNRPADAVTEYQAAVRISPTPANRLALATAYLRAGQNAAAAPLLEQALAANPNDFDVRMALGRIRRDTHDYPGAAREFLAAANLKPDSVSAWNEAASVLVLSEQYPQALAALDKVHNLNADTPGDLYYRAMVLDKLHQIKPALASYRRFLEMSQGKYPDQEFVARQRSRILDKEASR